MYELNEIDEQLLQLLQKALAGEPDALSIIRERVAEHLLLMGDRNRTEHLIRQADAVISGSAAASNFTRPYKFDDLSTYRIGSIITEAQISHASVHKQLSRHQLNKLYADKHGHPPHNRKQRRERTRLRGKGVTR